MKLIRRCIIIVLYLFCKKNAVGQVDCNTLDINKVPGKWVWASAASSFEDPIPASQWKFCEPIKKRNATYNACGNRWLVCY